VRRRSFLITSTNCFNSSNRPEDCPRHLSLAWICTTQIRRIGNYYYSFRWDRLKCVSLFRRFCFNMARDETPRVQHRCGVRRSGLRYWLEARWMFELLKSKNPAASFLVTDEGALQLRWAAINFILLYSEVAPLIVLLPVIIPLSPEALRSGHAGYFCSDETCEGDSRRSKLLRSVTNNKLLSLTLMMKSNLHHNRLMLALSVQGRFT